MNNILFDIRGDYKTLNACLDYLSALCPKGASHYTIVPRKGLVLFWTDPKDQYFTINSEARKIEVKTFDIDWKDFVIAWLKNANLNDFDLDNNWEKEIKDFDGTIGKGFRMNCHDFGYVYHCWSAFAIIKPIAAWYGK